MEMEKTLINILKRIDNYINLANVKATLLLSTNAIFISIILSQYSDISVKPFIVLNVDIFNYLFFSVILFSSISLIFSLGVIFAFLKIGNKEKYNSILFFGSIANMELVQFKSKISKIKKMEVDEDLIIQIHLLSRNLRNKYIKLNASCIFLGLAILAIIIIIINFLLE